MRHTHSSAARDTFCTKAVNPLRLAVGGRESRLLNAEAVGQEGLEACNDGEGELGGSLARFEKRENMMM
jgi:hypothetical protein